MVTQEVANMLQSCTWIEKLIMMNHSPLPSPSGDFTVSFNEDSSTTKYLPNMEELEEINLNSSPCRNFEKCMMVTQVRPKLTIVSQVAHTNAVTTNITKFIGYQVL